MSDEFIFESYHFDEQSGHLSLFYRCRNYVFEEKISLSLGSQENDKENEKSNDNEDKIRRKKCC